MEFLTTGKLAKLTNVNKETIRYYEKIGLIQEPPRGMSSGYRQYPHEVITRISFIKRAQTLGFSLNEIAEILTLRHKLGSSFKDIEAKVKMKLAEIEDKITALEAMKQALSKVIKSSDKKITESECPVLSVFEIKLEGKNSQNKHKT